MHFEKFKNQSFIDFQILLSVHFKRIILQCLKICSLIRVALFQVEPSQSSPAWVLGHTLDCLLCMQKNVYAIFSVIFFSLSLLSLHISIVNTFFVSFSFSFRYLSLSLFLCSFFLYSDYIICSNDLTIKTF